MQCLVVIVFDPLPHKDKCQYYPNKFQTYSYYIHHKHITVQYFHFKWEIGSNYYLPAPLYNSTMITLDGVPYMFGGSDGTSETDTVFRFKNKVWEEVGAMKAPRQNHVAFSIPEEWLCFGESYSTLPPSTITTSISGKTIQMSQNIHFSSISDFSTSTPCETGGFCSKTDQRGESWIGTSGKMTEHNCFEGNGKGKFCDRQTD